MLVVLTETYCNKVNIQFRLYIFCIILYKLGDWKLSKTHSMRVAISCCPLLFSRKNYTNLHWSGTQQHFALPVLESLNSHFACRWIGRLEPAERLPRSPDLTLCDFVLTSGPNTKCTDRKWPTLDELGPRIQNTEVLFSWHLNEIYLSN